MATVYDEGHGVQEITASSTGLRNNAMLNLQVLQLHYPQIISILAVTPHVQVYLFSHESQSWEKQQICGPLFVVDLQPQHTKLIRDFAVVILNRASLENFYLRLWGSRSCEVMGDYVMLAEESSQGNEGKAFGLWIHPGHTSEGGNKDLRRLVVSTILDCAAEVDATQLENADAPLDPPTSGSMSRVLPDNVANGTTISIADLLGTC